MQEPQNRVISTVDAWELHVSSGLVLNPDRPYENPEFGVLVKEFFNLHKKMQEMAINAGWKKDQKS